MNCFIGKKRLLRSIAVLGAVLGMQSPALANETVNEQSIAARVINGKIVREGEWLSQVSLARSYNANAPFCGGTLIAPNWVLTAGHCVDFIRDPSDMAVTIGLYEYKGFYNIDTQKGTPNAREYFRVEEIIINDDYLDFFEDDIALLKLNGYSQATPAAIYGGPSDLRSHYVSVVGFGSTIQQEIDFPVAPFYPSTKRTHDLTVQSNETCENRINGESPESEDDLVYKREKHLCISIQEGRKGTCQGDSGGPLYLRNADNRPVTAGVVSFGSGCAWPGYPGVFVRTSHYVDFIKGHVPEAVIDTTDYQHSVSRDISGAWYDPNRSGEGWIVEMQPNNRFSIFWFTFDYLGVPMYLYGSGDYKPGSETLNVELYKTDGARFGDAFNSRDVNMTKWGELVFKPKGCDSAMISYSSNDAMYQNDTRSVMPLYWANTSNCAGLWDGSKRQIAGTWYNPSRSGEGVVIQTRPDNHFSFYFFTYDMLGNQKTIFGDGILYNGKATANAYTAIGPKFQYSDSMFKQSTNLNLWGEVMFRKTNCDHIVMHYDANSSGYGVGTRGLSRLSHLEGDLCSE